MKIKKSILCAMIVSIIACNCVLAEESPTNPQTIDASESLISAIERADVSNSAPPTLVTPKVEDPALTPKKNNPTKKISLSAVIFDPNADFSESAKEENREMTRLENAEYNIHEALHGEVTSLSKMSRRGLFEKYLTVYPKSGPLYSITEYTGYKGYFTNAWSGDNYSNTLYSVETLCPTIEGLFKDKRTSFRSSYFLQPGKPGRDFFNDVWGDQYLQYAWSKDKKDQILVGYKRVTEGVEGSMGPWTLPLLMRTQIAKTYGNVRQLGVKAQGQHKFYDYTIEGGSSGRNFYAWFPGVEYSTSLAFKPLGATKGKYGNLAIGGGVTGGDSTGNGTYTVGNAYIDYEYKRWNLTAEYGSADGSNGSTGYTKNLSEGFNGTLAYRLTPKVQILGRYDQFDPNKNTKNDIRREYTVGLNYFVKDQFLKLILNYTIYSIEKGTYGSQILIGTQFVL